MQLPDMEKLRKDFYVIDKAPEPDFNQPVDKELDCDTTPINNVEEVLVKGSAIRKRRHMVAGRSFYVFEFLKVNELKTIQYHEPKTYLSFYNHIPELRYMNNIVCFLQEI